MPADPDHTRWLASTLGAVVGVWGSAVDAADTMPRWRWAAVVIGWLMSSVAAGYIVSTALQSAHVPADLHGASAEVLRWLLSWPTQIHAGIAALSAHWALPLLARLIRRRTGDA
jgi:hypothetical protein